MALKPSALKPGDTISVMSPSSFIKTGELNNAEKFLASQGYDVYIHPQTYEKYNQSAGTHEQKIEAFEDLLKNPDIKAIFMAGGGNRAAYLLDKINYDVVKEHPKIIFGFSDVSLLLNTIWHKAGLIGFHGPVFRKMGDNADTKFALNLLQGNAATYNFSQSKILKEGHAEGKLIGGCLSVIQTLIGTPYIPDLKGSILFLEDFGDHYSRYDRMFRHLRNSGILHQISGLILGEWSGIDAEDRSDTDRTFGFSIEDIVLENTHDLSIPVISNAPFGHMENNLTLPIGCKAKLENASLTLLESPLA